MGQTHKKVPNLAHCVFIDYEGVKVFIDYEGVKL